MPRVSGYLSIFSPLNLPACICMFPSLAGTLMNDARKSDCIIDHEDDVDWNNIIPTLEADFRSGECAFVSEIYDTHEDALKAMNAVIDRIFAEATNRVRSDSVLD